VIWLMWRRYRMIMGLAVVVLVGLGVWMLWAGHAFDVAVVSAACHNGSSECPIYSGTLSLSDQADVINFLLLFIPCLLGMVFGAPLVAGELEHSTNRLAWTQGISRTKWLIVKWCAVGVSLVIAVALLTLIVQWWTGNAIERIDTNWIGIGLNGGPLRPLSFPITGLAFSAYTLFAFALGTALGAVFRRTSWAVAGTLVIYTTVSVLVVLFIRPSLAPQLFVDETPVAAAANVPSTATPFTATVIHETAGSWDLGFGYRYAPGARVSGPAADVAGQRCQALDSTPYLACLADHHLQEGTFYVTANHYWELQWKESALLLLVSGALLGVTVWSVRRWTA
jgi:hypothetical protein